ncbi:sirohydrochlorin chelatase, partial [Streptomyces sp. Act-28]
MSTPTLVAVAHGSRDPRALPAVAALLALVRELRPGLPVRLGHVELDRPLLTDTLDDLPAGADAVLVPLLFGRGHHVKNDLPRAAGAAAPRVRARVAAPLGAHPLLVEALHLSLIHNRRCRRRIMCVVLG